jgi:hypothetical protein
VGTAVDATANAEADLGLTEVEAAGVDASEVAAPDGGDADPAGEIADATPVAHASADSDASSDEVTLQDAADTAPPSCFDAAPLPDTAVIDTVKPDANCDVPINLGKWKEADGAALAAPTLALEIGVGDAKGKFAPYTMDEWVPIVPGVFQPGYHVWAAVRTKVPAGATEKAVFETQAKAYLACGLVANSLDTIVSAVPDADVPDAMTTALPGTAGMRVAFGEKEVSPYCSQWLWLVVEARHKASGAWGRAEVRLRPYGIGVHP